MAQRRRPKGSGSISKLGTREWLARYTAPDGTRPSMTFSKQADAIEWLDEQVSAVRQGAYIAPCDMPLSDWIDKFLAAYRANAANATKQSYQESRARLIKYAPDLMAMALDRITQPDVQKALNLVAEKVDTRTVEITRSLLNISIKKAVELTVIRHNPVTGTTVDESDRVPRSKYIEPDMLKRILDYATRKSLRTRERPYEDIIYFIARTGCRTQEARGLLVENLRPTGCLIDRAMDKIGKMKKTKTANSIRFITLPDDVLEMVRHRAKHSISGHVFETKLGKPMDHRNIARRISTLTDGRHSPHDLRHTFATNAVRNGANPKALADYIGDDVVTVLKVYTHTDHADLTKVHMLAAQPSKVIEFKAE